MKKFLLSLVVLLTAVTVYAAEPYQVTNADFEDWSGAAFDGNIQPAGWNASNVTQFGFKFNFAHRETGHSGYCMMVQDQDVGAAGITETSPGYFSLGQPWVYISSLTAVNQASAGTYGGVKWAHRPDSMSVWIKRTGSNTDKEDFYLLYYSWSGTAQSVKYKGKNGSCTSTGGYTDEESDIRQALDGNECGTNTMAKQVSEGMWRERKTYGNWTNIRVPIYYMNNDVPEKMNIIFSASNYPNFRANSGLYAGNSLYVDDVEFIYSSKIQTLYVDGSTWKGFDPNSTEVQVYSLGESATSIPEIEAFRGAGTLSNARGTTVTFAGRKLSGSEISIEKGDLDKKPTVITVKSEDGKSTTTYKIQFQKAASSNAKLAGISYVYGTDTTLIPGFSPTKYNYEVELPYGTKKAPVIVAELQEDKQTVNITQPTSETGTSTIKVTAANGTATQTYTLNFKVGLLSDNELQDILVNGKSVPGFTPSQTVYKVSLPVTTTEMPTVTTVSKPEYGNDQTVVHTKPSVIDGGVYQLSVTTPGNKIAKVYKLNFKLEKSSYSYLKDLKVEGGYIAEFQPNNFTYYINLPMGTTSLPKITYTMGDEFQTVNVSELGAGVVDGTVRITVTAGNGDQSVYKLVFSTEKSDISTLNGIKIGGVALEGFSPEVTSYSYQLPVGTETLPEIEPILGDQYQTYAITTAGLNGKTRITVTAGDGSTTIYMIAFSVEVFSENTLQSLFLNGALIDGWNPETNEYWVNLPQGTTELPTVTYELKDPNFQTASVRTISGLNGDYKITVRPQSGASRTYIIHFSVATSSNTALKDLKVAGYSLQNDLGEDVAFDPEVLDYYVTLDEGISTIPAVSFTKAENSQRVLSVLNDTVQSITVTAQSGATRTYTITFHIQLSQNAFLEMIYLDGDSLKDFEKETLTYTVMLDGETCPVITVDKAAGQQVTITAPYGAGTATIKVQPEVGAANLYKIKFEAVAPLTARLDSIKINGVPLAEFVPTTLAYTATYEKEYPLVEGVKSDEASQSILELWKDSVVWLHVFDTLGNQAAYSVTFTRHLVENNDLLAILIDGTPLDKFKPEVLHYDSALAAGSTYPEVRYIAADNAQVVFFGQDSVGHWGISVAAENGDIKTYTVQFNILPYDDARLENLEVAGDTIGFAQETYTYNLNIDDGAKLPAVTATSKPGQTVLSYNVSETQQQVLVIAESGATAIYNIMYTRVPSNNALLADILIDGVSITGFDPATRDYTVNLPQGTKVVPNVFPVGQLPNQTITTYVCHPDGVTQIHVEAQDGTTADYSVAFPLAKSSTVALQSIQILESDDFFFDPETTEYFDLTLPQGTTASPKIDFEKKETVQDVEVVWASLNDTSKLIVTAENGDQRTYQFTYRIAPSVLPNKLAKLTIADTLDLDVATKTNFTVVLPYTTTEMPFTYVKNFAEQTVSVVDGGIYQPSTITVYSNRPDEDSTVYVITPQLITYTPAVLTSLTINDEPISGFQPDQFSYIINVTATPTPGYTAADGIEVVETEKDSKHVKYTVKNGTFTNVYTMYYYYEEDLIPSNNFTEWSLTKYNNAQKPTGWMAPADAAEKHTWLYKSTYTGAEVNGIAPNGVVLRTHREASDNSIYGSIPGIITTGQLNMTLKSAGNSTSSVSDINTKAVTFRNTPEQIYVEYNCMEQEKMDFWRLWVELNDGSNTKRTTTTTEQGKFEDVGLNVWHPMTMDLDYSGLSSVIQKMNITLNSAHSDNASDLGGITERRSTVYFRSLRFLFNSKFASATVDGDAAVVDNTEKTITYAISDPEYAKVPELAFVGQKPDQAHRVIMGAEINGIRTAQVINYGEDGTNTTYSVTITRPLSAEKRLSAIKVKGTGITGFSPETNTYNYTIANGTRELPDVQATPLGTHEKISVAYEDKKAVITVTSETGEDNVYTINFVEAKSNSTELALIDAEGVTFVAATREYHLSVETLPAIAFTRLSDGQHVDMKGGKLMVTAEDGTKGEYNIIRDLPATPGQISEFTLNGNIQSYLGGTTYDAEGERLTDPLVYTLQHVRDSVVFVQDPQKLQWQVYGSTNHAYTYSYPSEKSNNAKLASILLNGINYDEFDPGLSSDPYVISSDTIQLLKPIAAEDVQSIVTTQTVVDEGVVEGIEYTIGVTAEDGVAATTYKVRVLRPKSNIVTLAGIMLDSVLIDGFDPATEHYTVTLPTPAVKVEQPKMPSVTYAVGQAGQQVEVVPGKLNGDPTYFTVHSEDETATKYYDLTINVEPSHCVDLTGITVNGVPVQGDKDEQFEPGRHFYSLSLKTSQITVDYTSADRFQTVTIIPTELEKDSKYRYILHVVAEDGVNYADYQINIYVENKSTDAELANITLDGKNFVDFERALNEDLTFKSDKPDYFINLPAGRTILPEVNAQLKMDGQTVEIEQIADTILLHVTAVDGVTMKTYELHFEKPLSTNANLSMIFLNGDSLPDFDPTYYFYQIDLPVGTHELPEVAAQKAEAAQTILPIDIDHDKLQATIKVQAEDPTTRENTYVVVFHFTQSDADSLAMIYQDGKNLEGFEPKTTYYALSLPVGTPAFPDLSWETADDWQTAMMDTVESSDNQLIRQIIVTSESGKKRTYTVSYTILKSDIDTLQMIFVDQKQLEGFNARTEEYFYQLTASYAAELGGQVPLVEYISGDEYQTVLVSQVRDSIAGKSLGYKSIVTVTAATGTSRTYTIHYPVEKSSEATLNMINLAGKPLTNYDAERFNYKVEIGMEAAVPAVTVIKKEEVQVVEIILVEDVVTIVVTAEDGTQQTYTLNFERVMSDITTLLGVNLTYPEQVDPQTYPFIKGTYTYTINVAYSADKPLEDQIPAVDPLVMDVQQTADTVHHLLENGDIRVDITVTAPDGENQAIYSLTFHFLKPTDATLINILLKGEELANFVPQNPLKTEYSYAHPYGSTTADYFTAEDVEAMLSDSLATYTISENEEGTIYIRVIAQDGVTEITYQITQSIAKDNDCLLSAIYLGEPGDETEPLRGFDPEVTFYTYMLRQGSTTTPSVLAIPRSENAEKPEVRVVPAGDTCTIICTAADGTKLRYYIYFAISDISEAAEATSNDVVIKRLPGTNKLFVGTIRKDVHFLLMDQNGHRLFYEQIPTANPNDIDMSNDLETAERLNDVIDSRSGLEIEVNPDQIYFYTFFYGDKDFIQMMKGDDARKLKSGKIILRR